MTPGSSLPAGGRADGTPDGASTPARLSGTEEYPLGDDLLVYVPRSETAYALKQLVQAGVRVFFYMENRERTLDSPTDKIMLSLTAFVTIFLPLFPIEMTAMLLGPRKQSLRGSLCLSDAIVVERGERHQLGNRPTALGYHNFLTTVGAINES